MIGESLRRLYEPESIAETRLARTPEAIQLKLAYVDELATEAMSVHRETQARLREARSDLRDASSTLEQVKADKVEAERVRRNSGGRFTDQELENFRSPRSPLSIPAIEARIARATKLIEPLARRATEASERSNSCGRLAMSCTQWVKSREPNTLVEASARARDAYPARLADAVHLPGELAKVRATLQAIARERAAAAAAGVPLEEARARVHAYVDYSASAFVPDVRYFFQNDYGAPGHSEGYRMGAVPNENDPILMRAYVVFLLADQIKATLAPALARAASTFPLLLDPAERIRRLEDLDARAYGAGVLEESLVLKHEAAGLAVLRREDADPEVVLCVTAEDPA